MHTHMCIVRPQDTRLKWCLSSFATKWALELAMFLYREPAIVTCIFQLHVSMSVCLVSLHVLQEEGFIAVENTMEPCEM